MYLGEIKARGEQLAGGGPVNSKPPDQHINRVRPLPAGLNCLNNRDVFRAPRRERLVAWVRDLVPLEYSITWLTWASAAGLSAAGAA